MDSNILFEKKKTSTLPGRDLHFFLLIFFFKIVRTDLMKQKEKLHLLNRMLHLLLLLDLRFDEAR